MDNTITAQEAINSLGKISKARFLAMDEDGQWFAYRSKPNRLNTVWMVEGGLNDGSMLDNKYLFDIQPAENWKESLVEYQP